MKTSAGLQTSGTTDETGENRIWNGPFPEPNAYGGHTGEYYVECTGCGIEVLEQDQDRAHHREGFPQA